MFTSRNHTMLNEGGTASLSIKRNDPLSQSQQEYEAVTMPPVSASKLHISPRPADNRSLQLTRTFEARSRQRVVGSGLVNLGRDKQRLHVRLHPFQFR